MDRIEATLTISRHANGDAFLQAAVLAAVPVDPQDGALLVLGAGAILDLLLDAAAEESLEDTKRRKRDFSNATIKKMKSSTLECVHNLKTHTQPHPSNALPAVGRNPLTQPREYFNLPHVSLFVSRGETLSNIIVLKNRNPVQPPRDAVLLPSSPSFSSSTCPRGPPSQCSPHDRRYQTEYSGPSPPI